MLYIKGIIGTASVLLILAVVIGMVIFTMIKNKKEGKTSCGCGCSSCAMKDVCHTKDEEKGK